MPFQANPPIEANPSHNPVRARDLRINTSPRRFPGEEFTSPDATQRNRFHISCSSPKSKHRISQVSPAHHAPHLTAYVPYRPQPRTNVHQHVFALPLRPIAGIQIGMLRQRLILLSIRYIQIITSDRILHFPCARVWWAKCTCP